MAIFLNHWNQMCKDFLNLRHQGTSKPHHKPNHSVPYNLKSYPKEN